MTVNGAVKKVNSTGKKYWWLVAVGVAVVIAGGFSAAWARTKEVGNTIKSKVTTGATA